MLVKLLAPVDMPPILPVLHLAGGVGHKRPIGTLHNPAPLHGKEWVCPGCAVQIDVELVAVVVNGDFHVYAFGIALRADRVLESMWFSR